MIRAELHGCDRAMALGIEVQADAPILRLCRKLIAAGNAETEPLDAYRGEMLCLRVRSIGEAAKLAVNQNGTGFKKHVPFPGIASPSPVEQD